jgi:hypothetical protein
MSRSHSPSDNPTGTRTSGQNFDPAKGPVDHTIKNPRGERGKLIEPGEPTRPDPKLATIGEAHAIATELMKSGVVVGDVRMHDAEPNSGMPVSNGEFRPLLLTFTDTHPVTVQPVTFHVPAGVLAAELEKMPHGEWFLDHDDRMVKRRAV